MISLDQIQLLEKKVETAIQRIVDLQAENTVLKSSNAELKSQNDQLVQKVADLQESVSVYELDKDRIEQGILGALQRLGEVENTVLKNGQKINIELGQEKESSLYSGEPVKNISTENTSAKESLFSGAVNQMQLFTQSSASTSGQDISHIIDTATPLPENHVLETNAVQEEKLHQLQDPATSNPQFDIF